jgi:hypothetical protein
LQEKVGVQTGESGDLFLTEKTALSHSAAWLTYPETETAEQKATRIATYQAFYVANEAAKALPNDQAVQAKYVAAKQA